MIDPFAAALAVLHSGAGSVAAVYTPAGGQPISLRALWDQGSSDVGAQSRRIMVDGNKFDVMRSDVDRPQVNDTIAVVDPRNGEARTFRINGDALLDVEGITWTCPTEEVWSDQEQP